MTKPLTRDAIYRRRRYPADLIELCVRWYITYRLSYRDLAAMMAERGIFVSHTTILRWVLRYVPEYEERWRRYVRPVNPSWRMDETAVPVRGGHHYLYRAVDKYGKSVDSLLCRSRDMAAAQAFFRHAVAESGSGWPDRVNVDGHAATHRALRLLGQNERGWRSVVVRSNRYLNNIVEQDHRAIKRRCAGMLGLKTFRTAAITLSGIELAHRIRKGQFRLVSDLQSRGASLKQLWDIALLKPSRVQSCASLSVNAPELKVRRLSADRNPSARNQPLRYARKITDRRGLYLLEMPNGGRYWRYNYQFEGKRKTLALGVYPDVSLEKARARHQHGRCLLADGVDPSRRKQELRTSRIATYLASQVMDHTEP